MIHSENNTENRIKTRVVSFSFDGKSRILKQEDVIKWFILYLWATLCHYI